MEEKKLAKQFHDTYERLAPQFGYETRKDTKEFEEDSPNGKLMIAVCKEVMLKELDRAREEGREEGINTVLYPRFKRENNGTLKREGWVDKSKLTTK